MKTMYDLNQLASMLQSNAKASEDYIVPMRHVSMNEDAMVAINGVPGGARSLTTIGHSQLGETLGIPKPYYDKMLGEDRGLLAMNVNTWLQRRPDERRMVRALRGEYRAFLSDRYQRIDNKEVAEVVLNALTGIRGVCVVSSAITETRMHIKAVSYSVQAEVRKSKQVGDVIAAGVYISNSEVGMGSVSIKPFVERLVCKNGMVRDDGKLRANHVGRKHDESIEGLLSDETRRLEDAVVLRKVRDVLLHSFDADKLQQFADRLSDAAEVRINGNVPDVVQALGPTVGLQVGEQQSVLRHLIEGGDLSKWGMANAVTRAAEDIESYDRATELEAAGFKIISMSQREWDTINADTPRRARRTS